ncbi:MAG: antibiotic biosynthesis monooxygenase [Pseudomonadales bacterium]|nr:antibiotic biosynthesis monooxygenase [Pseudomonadales bacterium]
MSIIVAGWLSIKPGARNEFIQASCEAILQARNHTACSDFSVSPDPLDDNRINIFENWETREALETFRASGPEHDLFSLVTQFSVSEYEVI